MDLREFNKEQVVKVMLQIAKNKRPLSKTEEKYDLSIQDVLEVRAQEITSFLEKEGCVEQHPVFIDRPSPSVVIMPFPSSEGEGLSPKGECELEDLIGILEKEKKEKRKGIILSIFKWITGGTAEAFKWIMGIVATIIGGVVIAYICWHFGWL